VAAVWGFIQRLGVVEVIDEVAGARPIGTPVPR
jgi:hypothetical protein